MNAKPAAPKPFTLVVAYDGSPCSEAAVDTLGSAGLPDVGVAYVVSVAETALLAGDAVGYGFTLGESITLMEREARESTERGARRLRELMPGWTVTPRAVQGSAYWSIVEEAEAARADLISVGTHGWSAAGRLLLGSTSQFVLSHSPCSVRVARPCESPAGRPPRLLIAVDGSSDANAALAAIRARHWPKGTEARLLVAVNVGDAVAVRSRAHSGKADDGFVMPERVLEAAASALEHHGLDLAGELVEGDPRRVIVERARRYESDCIFLGARGHSLLRRLTTGSVSASVVSHAPCSVEVVRAVVPPAPPAAFATDHLGFLSPAQLGAGAPAGDYLPTAWI